ncbi:hypothetical protein FNV43_RR15170 [Rhamnella rubrinervis]|uniref:MATH domain-containing protein n=1 Tax=Rhamnella rubrinervis TaxID=2594499 RepID=A0A8K0E121_9ROSA|nr:hypothetical protein FNV43_RR15170 [Rhamnella rubrinervis]
MGTITSHSIWESLRRTLTIVPGRSMSSLCYCDGGVKRFHEMKKQWGYARLLSLKTFKDSSNGYLFNDSCVFGVEIFVINCSGKWESLSLLTKPANGTFTWKISNFSKLAKYNPHYSDVFNVGGVDWKLMIYPSGVCRLKDNSFSFYLILADWDKHSTKESVFAKYILRVLSRDRVHNCEKSASGRSFTYNKSRYGDGYSGFMALKDLLDPSKYYIVNDSLNVEVELLAVSSTETSSMRKRKHIKIEIN